MERHSLRPATLLRIEPVARDTFVYTLHLPDPMPFAAGQFLNLAVPDAKPRGERSYSIYSDPARPEELQLCIKLLEGGAASEYLRVRKEGDILQVRGPFGVFTLGAAHNPVTFVATATGLAPFHSMLLQAAREKDPRRFRLFFGVRAEEDVFAVDTLQRLKGELDFDFTLCLSRKTGNGPCFEGRVTSAIVAKEAAGHYYLCGNGPMIEEVKGLLKEKGLDRKQIHAEKYY